MFPRAVPHAWFAWLILASSFSGAVSAQTNDLSGTNDASIRNVLTVVADRQLRLTASGSAPRTLTDGNYATAYTLSAATNATRPLGIEWDYPWGVNLYGLLQTYRATGNTNYVNFVRDHNRIVARYYAWLKSLNTSVTNATPAQILSFQTSTAMREFFILDRLDYCGAMTAQFLEDALHYPTAPTIEQVQVGLTTANWVSTGQSRLPDGTLWRPGANDTIWADDLYMSCPFLIRWYLYTGNTNFLDDAARQVQNIAGYLQDTNGLWYHGSFYDTSSVNGFKWGRANGWAMVTTVEVLSVMPLNHPARSNLLSILTRHIEGVESVQAPSGMWRQVLDNTNLWEETSCTAMFSYSIARAVNRGWIDSTNMAVARRGFAALCKNLTTNGVVNGTCQGTGIGTTLSFYINRLRPSDDMHGRGPVLLAGSEILLRPELSLSNVAGRQVAVSWNAGITNTLLEESTNLMSWRNSPAVPAVSNWLNVVTTETDQPLQFYRLHLTFPVYPSAPLTYEAEALGYAANGAAAAVSPDTNSSGGLFVTLNADGIGDYIEFTLTNVPAGSYHLELNFKSDDTRGQVNFTLDGSPLGDALDQFWPAATYPLVDFGPATFAAPGDHVLQLIVSGKSDASTGYTGSADRFLLVPQ